MADILRAVCREHQLDLLDFRRLTGGDINEVFLLKTNTASFVLKLNDAHDFPKMFEAEAKGLKLLNHSKSFRIPEVKAVGQIQETAYLLMEFLPQGSPSSSFWEDFAYKLVRLHSVSDDQFGLDHDNFIGSLPQYNKRIPDACTFYIEQRLEPQLQWAGERGYTFKSDSLYRNLESEIPKESPSLIHGDLWSGNYLVGKENQPILIDPAVAYAPREMDLGMMQLFGGFPERVYLTYNEHFPLEKGWQSRTPIWQMYYLLVHLNLFGSGYYSQVKHIVDRFS